MLGMHGSVAANYATTACDLLVSFGARFDDRVTGKLDEFAPKATIAHLDIDPSAISKSVPVDIPVVGDVKRVLGELIKLIEPRPRESWLAQVANWKSAYPFSYDRSSPKLLPQFVIERIYEITRGEAVIVTDVGQHRMGGALLPIYKPRRYFLRRTGTMGYGLPAAIGAQGMPKKQIVLISGAAARR